MVVFKQNHPAFLKGRCPKNIWITGSHFSEVFLKSKRIIPKKHTSQIPAEFQQEKSDFKSLRPKFQLSAHRQNKKRTKPLNRCQIKPGKVQNAKSGAQIQEENLPLNSRISQKAVNSVGSVGTRMFAHQPQSCPVGEGVRGRSSPHFNGTSV